MMGRRILAALHLAPYTGAHRIRPVPAVTLAELESMARRMAGLASIPDVRNNS